MVRKLLDYTRTERLDGTPNGHISSSIAAARVEPCFATITHAEDTIPPELSHELLSGINGRKVLLAAFTVLEKQLSNPTSRTTSFPNFLEQLAKHCCSSQLVDIPHEPRDTCNSSPAEPWAIVSSRNGGDNAHRK